MFRAIVILKIGLLKDQMMKSNSLHSFVHPYHRQNDLESVSIKTHLQMDFRNQKIITNRIWVIYLIPVQKIIMSMLFRMRMVCSKGIIKAIIITTVMRTMPSMIRMRKNLFSMNIPTHRILEDPTVQMPSRLVSSRSMSTTRRIHSRR